MFFQQKSRLQVSKKTLMPNAEKKQGSTDQECCIDKE